MIISSIVLAFSSSIDSLGIGITYGIKNTKISNTGKILLFFISFFITIFSLYLGSLIKNIFSEFLTKLFGSLILIIIGLSFLLPNFKTSLKKDKKNFKGNCFKKIISIIKNPISSDIDNSKIIDLKESIFLGIALCLDSFCIGVGSSIIGINYIFFPLLVSSFQFFFLNFGNYFGRKIYTLNLFYKFHYSIISGILLIVIGILRFFCN